MFPLRKKRYADIPLRINGELKFITGVSKYTTCNDVIKMVLRKTQIGKDNSTPDDFGIYESSLGKEHLVPAKSRILTVISSWGSVDKYELVLRTVNTTSVASKMPDSKLKKEIHMLQHTKRAESVRQQRTAVQNCSDQPCIGKICRNGSVGRHSNRVSSDNVNKYVTGKSDSYGCEEYFSTVCNVNKYVTGKSDSYGCEEYFSTACNVNNAKFAVRKILKTKHCDFFNRSENRNSTHTIHDTPNTKVAKQKCRAIYRHETLARDISTKVAHMSSREGKEALLQKYFSDYITYQSPSCKLLDSRYREQGDGVEDVAEICPFRRGDGSEHNTIKSNDFSPVNLLHYNDLNESFDSGNAEDLDAAFNYNVQGTSTDFSAQTPYVSPIVKQTSIRITSDGAKNTPSPAKVGKLVDYSLSDDSLLSDPSDISSTSSTGDNLVHNVSTVSDIVMAVFNKNRVFDEDDEMESFMETKMCYTSDEGLSSLDSDDEREILV